jgi:uncharacterized protein (TIGR02265 family)
MLIALAGERPFGTPRTKFELDLDAIAARVPGTATTKGMFFTRALSQLPRQIDDEPILRAAGLEESRFVPFNSYPWIDFIRLCCAIADVMAPSRPVGLRKIGRTLYSEFADSLAGRVTFGLLRNNADRVISLGAKAWNISGAPGEVVGESIGDCHYRYHFNDYPAEITETLAVGVLEGALVECDEIPRILFGQADPMHAVLDIRWGEAEDDPSPAPGPGSPEQS